MSTEATTTEPNDSGDDDSTEGDDDEKRAESPRPPGRMNDDSDAPPQTSIIKELKVVDDPVTAMELGKLSHAERQQLLQGIHGKAPIEDEDPMFVTRRLSQMDEEIESLRHRSASAYNLATFLAPRKVKDRAFRLMFLRAELFDARRAAKRIIKHFEYKMKLFGEDKVAKQITLEDFEDVEQEDSSSLASGSVQVLPCTDTSGRAVIFFGASHANYKSWKNELRSLWYALMSALEDSNAQRRGMVLIIYTVGGCQSDGKSVTELLMNSYLVKDGVPARFSAIHYCFDNEQSRPCLSLLRSVGGKDFRLRCQDHFGTHQECHYELMDYGIASGILPVDSRGLYWKDDLKRFIEARRWKEEKDTQTERSSNLIDVATSKDVLFGRGKPFQEHEGNIHLARLIEARQNEYMKANRIGKTSISWEIVRFVQKDNGSFLKKDEASSAWELVSDLEARDKVAHGFRTKTRAREISGLTPAPLPATEPVMSRKRGISDVE